MTYEEAVAALGAMMARGWRLELDRMRELCRRLGVAEGGSSRFVHVAGTNGKGSVTAYVQNMLVAQGYVTGAYYSPYVYDLRERVQIGLGWIEKDMFARLMARIVAVGDAMVDTDLGGPTEFEAKTALGFMAWQEAGCDAVALEVGLGGRLDATNIVDPVCSVVVSIGYDHMHILGDTLAQIAREKAGIIKPGRPVVVGDLAEEAWASIDAVARQADAPVWRYGRDVVVEQDGGAWAVSTPAGRCRGLRPGIRGSVQPHNMALAWAAVEAAGLMRDRGDAAEGVAATRLPGRFEVHEAGGRTHVLDGAHNPASAAALVQSLTDEFEGRDIGFVVGMLRGHEPGPFLAELASRGSKCAVVPVDNERGLEPGEVADAARRVFPSVDVFPDAATAAAWLGTPVVVVTGSFYLLGSAKASLSL